LASIKLLTVIFGVVIDVFAVISVPRTTGAPITPLALRFLVEISFATEIIDVLTEVLACNTLVNVVPVTDAVAVFVEVLACKTAP
jgi:hypothetical protein